MKALILVDIQNDFTPAGRGTPAGALAVPDGDEVIQIANRLMTHYDFVVATQDWHPADHLSFASQHPGKNAGDVVELDGLQQILWPDHCVENTRGAEFCPSLELARIDEIVRKGTERKIDSYSGFFDNGHRSKTRLADVLSARSVDEVHVLGLATDYCVKFTALDARRLGLATTLILEGCRAVELNPGDGAAAIEEMVAAGVIIQSETLLGGKS